MSSATEGFHIPGPRRPTCSRLPHSPRRRNKYLSVPRGSGPITKASGIATSACL